MINSAKEAREIKEPVFSSNPDDWREFNEAQGGLYALEHWPEVKALVEALESQSTQHHGNAVKGNHDFNCEGCKKLKALAAYYEAIGKKP